MRLLRGGLRRDLVITESLAASMTGPELAWICKAHHPGKPIGGYAEMEGVAPDLPRLTSCFEAWISHQVSQPCAERTARIANSLDECLAALASRAAAA
jgi:hypothetical protein